MSRTAKGRLWVSFLGGSGQGSLQLSEDTWSSDRWLCQMSLQVSSKSKLCSPAQVVILTLNFSFKESNLLRGGEAAGMEATLQWVGHTVSCGKPWGAINSARVHAKECYSNPREGFCREQLTHSAQQGGGSGPDPKRATHYSVSSAPARLQMYQLCGKEHFSRSSTRLLQQWEEGLPWLCSLLISYFCMDLTIQASTPDLRGYRAAVNTSVCDPPHCSAAAALPEWRDGLNGGPCSKKTCHLCSLTWAALPLAMRRSGEGTCRRCIKWLEDPKTPRPHTHQMTRKA